jgi:hypothetical protein
MEYNFKNRHDETISFIGEGESFEMKGGDFYRYLFNVDKESDLVTYTAVDPMGGPFIGLGMDMGYIHDDLKGLMVESIDKVEDKIILNTKRL